jgi:3-phytase
MISRRRHYVSLLVVIACSDGDQRSTGPPPTTVDATFVTPEEADDGLDSPAIWTSPSGQRWLVATAKGTDQLHVYDATSGARIRATGREGTALGEFRRPNGIAIVGDLALVVERDNRRVQILRLPNLDAVIAFGGRWLSRPYGIAVLPRDSTTVEIFVTDNYRGPFGRVPVGDEMGQRVKRFRIAHTGARVVATYLGAFGATAGPGRLSRVESIAVDPDAGLLLVADELSRDVKVYRTDGSFTGRVLWGDAIRHEPEGIALYACGARDGYWIVTDQDEEENRCLVFRRASFEPVGAFASPAARNTDGIALLQRTEGRMPAGALYVQNDDRSIVALSWAEIAARLGLRTDCAGDAQNRSVFR